MGITDAIDLTTEQRSQLITLVRRFLPGIAVWAYGSRVKWTARPTSDLDLVAFASPAQRSQVTDLKEALAESNLPFPVDLHVWDEVPERFREIIRKEYVVVQEAERPESDSGDLGIAAKPQTIPLSDLSIRITKGTTPTTLGHPFVEKGINFVKSEAISASGDIDPSTFAYISEDTHDALSRSQLQEGDVLFSMAGVYLGKTAVVPRSILPANTNQAVGIIRLNFEKAEPRFIHYALSSPECRSWVQRSVAQSAQPNFNLRDIGNLPIPALSLSEQRGIAHILGTLDDKIELNRRMNETLEAMARALFKSWFVDFDPVRAKAEGRDTGLPKPIADLFPNSFEDSELGEIPRGWRAALFHEAALLYRDTVNPLDTPDAEFVHFSIPAYDEGGTPKCELGATIKSLKFRVPDDGILFSKLNPAIERVWLVDFPPKATAVCSTEFLVFRARSPFTRAFIYSLARSTNFRYAIQSSVTGTSNSHQRTQPDSVLSILSPIPSHHIIDAFEKIVAPLLLDIQIKNRESRTLAVLRDTLLPRLLSGEIRLKDVQTVTKEVL